MVELLDVTFERLMAARRGAALATLKPGVAEAEANALMGGALALGTTMAQSAGGAAPANPNPSAAEAEANALLGGALALATTMAQSAGGARLLVDQGILTRLLALGRWLLGANGGGACPLSHNANWLLFCTKPRLLGSMSWNAFGRAVQHEFAV